jgi:hypothetical protein
VAIKKGVMLVFNSSGATFTYIRIQYVLGVKVGARTQPILEIEP